MRQGDIWLFFHGPTFKFPPFICLLKWIFFGLQGLGHNVTYIVGKMLSISSSSIIHPRYYKHLKKGAHQIHLGRQKWAGCGRLACTSSKTKILNKIGIWIWILNFQVNIQFFFHPKNLKSENNNPWIKPWFNILMHTQSIVCATLESQLKNLGFITLPQIPPRFS